MVSRAFALTHLVHGSQHNSAAIIHAAAASAAPPTSSVHIAGSRVHSSPAYTYAWMDVPQHKSASPSPATAAP